MKQISTNDFLKYSKFTGECYGKRVSIEIDHSDLDIDELMDAFKGITMALGFSEESWNQWISETGKEMEFEYEDSEINLPHSNQHWNDEKPTFDWQHYDDTDYLSIDEVDERDDNFKQAAEILNHTIREVNLKNKKKKKK